MKPTVTSRQGRDESLLKRALTANVLLVGGSVVVLTALFLFTQRNALLRQLELRAEELARFVANEVQYPLLVGNQAELGRIAQNTLKNEDVLFVVLADRSGRSLITVQQPGFRGKPQTGAERNGLFRTLQPPESFELVHPVSAPHADSLVEWQSPAASSETLGAVRLGFSMRKERALFANTAFWGVAVAAFSMIIILGVQFLQLSRLLMPLRGLIGFTRQVGTGNLTQKAPVLRPDEVGRLALAFNQMVDQLRATTVSRDYVDNIIRSIGDALIVADRNLNIQTVNRAATVLLGYREEQLLGHRVDIVLGENESLDRILSETEAASGGCAGVERTYRASDGRAIPVLFSATELRNAAGDIEGLVWLAQDMTERKRAQEELVAAKQAAEESSRAKSTFLANMSHELRTPLNAIIGYSEMLQEEAEESGMPQFIQDLQRIHSAGKHLLALINDVLDLSKIEAGKTELYFESFPVAQMVQETLSTIEPMAKKRGNRLAVRYGEGLGRMQADLVKFRQSLLNLLSNACKFTENGAITLDVNRVREGSTDWIEWTVCDTGIGIAPEHMDKLFRSFSQVDASTTRKYGGTGLGLAISKRFCQLMGGDITARSEPGRGSTFTIRLPGGTAPEPSVQPGAGHAALAGGYPPQGRPASNTVLVIDDDATVHDLMARSLSKEGFVVENAFSGEAGLRKARELVPMAITLDVLMPEMDGWSVLAALKADPVLCNTPVILHTITDNRSLGYVLGAADYLQKPIDPERLLEVLRKYRRTPAAESVLVVEDDPSSRDIIMRLLHKGFGKVVGAENGRAALSRVVEEKPGVIVLDLMMPQMDGFEFVSELRKKEEWGSIPVVVLTAKDVTQEDLRRLNGFVDGVLQKGRHVGDDLVAAVCDLAAKRAMACETVYHA